MSRKPRINKPTISIVGAGSLANSLAKALHDSGFSILEIIARDSPPSQRRARALAAKVGARAVSAASARLDAHLLWFCVPDRAIRAAASDLALHLARRGIDAKTGSRFAFHSSGVLLSRELESLRRVEVAVASVHPLMTFVPNSQPSFDSVPFALEGDTAAVQVARQIVAQLGGESFQLPASRKAAYHAWATMTSPLFLAFLVTLEQAARVAGLAPADARRKSLPIIRQTLENYLSLGSKKSFSGPLIRGDAETVAKHMQILEKDPVVREVYRSLATVALRQLPVKNKKLFKKLLG